MIFSCFQLFTPAVRTLKRLFRWKLWLLKALLQKVITLTTIRMEPPM